MKKTKAKRGRKPEILKIKGDLSRVIKNSLTMKRPKSGWPTQN
jgi:hypothetical protein